MFQYFSHFFEDFLFDIELFFLIDISDSFLNSFSDILIVKIDFILNCFLFLC